MLLGAIADDLTGATDLALMLSREGMRTIQTVGVPPADFDLSDVDAVVVALKSRTNPAEMAIAMSLEALRWLKTAGARQIIFKYCSTFDSTPKGNIGPVTDALARELGTDLTIVCPAFPANRRTIYKGHLFVADQLLSDSPMRHHPLTPMTDSSLVRLMAAQSKLQVGLVSHENVAKGAESVRAAFDEARRRGDGVVVVDAITDQDLRVIGEAVAEFPLITGGSGIAIGLPENFRRAGLLQRDITAGQFQAPDGRAAILAGSCSEATRGQIKAAIEAGMPTLKLDPVDIAQGRMDVDEAIRWALAQEGVPLIYSSADPKDVLAAQESLGQEKAGEIVEQFLAKTAIGLRENGVRRLIVAGGETSGAVVGALAPSALFIGREIDPGVPWTLTMGDGAPMALALKSGNFGTADFFLKAWELLK
ncbi:four-carbon acid sugar kinase family protein [Rhizobium sp. CFBP 13726]|uniref:3-oxo-tetronate kinase n=1 Tax=Rhizobium sp. CFBP 13726 TaxID=2775296 RepID=UPI00177F576D|nr:3-oxo-tetronate kinase [Rhizobium sp. CFBP 13726]MBD8653354.1 four-carbon acid sugar kinase family protein [Rhizobium sp. CFBP 13726]